MKKTIQIEPHVDSIILPENLRVGLMVSEQRKKCQSVGCDVDFYGFAFGQSPFHVPEPIARALGKHATKGHYSNAEGIYELRNAIADFNELAKDLKRKGVSTSNELGRSLIAHPHHIATVTGDACMLKPDDFGARIAFVDYNGKQAYEAYRANPPKTHSEEIGFVNQNAPRMVNGIEALKDYVAFIKS